MFRKLSAAVAVAATVSLALAQAAAACGFLVAPNGAVRLVRTTTFVAWDGEVERYITNFEFQSDQESFGSIIPLPGEPTHVGKAGEWTLQRLDREVRPTALTEQLSADDSASAAGAGVEVILETEVDSLDITVVKGGGADVAAWAGEQGFDLGAGTDDDVVGSLDYYGDRSPTSSPPGSTSTARLPTTSPPATASLCSSRCRSSGHGSRSTSSASTCPRTHPSRPTCSCSPRTNRSCCTAMGCR